MNEHAQRWSEWVGDHGDLEAIESVRLLIATGQYLSLLIPPDVVDELWKILFDRVLGLYEMLGTDLERYSDASWETIWEEFGIPHAQALLGGPPFEDLNGFAFFGLAPASATGTPEAVAADIEERIERCRKILNEKPPHWPETPDMEQTVLAAEARFRLDNGQDVSPEQLAAIARVSVRSIRNLMSSRVLISDGRHIPNGDALRWLSSRSDFKSSIWRDGNLMFAPSEAASEELEDVLFVPVAKDGSWFDPVTCRRNGQYTVGARGSEERMADYRSALDRLWRMPTPHWRRPNAVGNWGIVTGVSWQRKVAAELGLDSSTGGQS